MSENSIIQQGHMLVFIDLVRLGGVAISYSKDMSVILYFASGTFGDDTLDLVTQL